MTEQNTPVAESSHCPIVLVCGFLGPSNAHWSQAYWGEATKLGSTDSPVLIPPISSVASAFDRACELFAAIKGLVVDYGEEHAAEHQHARFGKDFKGQGCYEEWSAEKPVHFIGHSFGGNTIRVLAYLLEIDFWKVGSSIHWVRSMVTLSSPLQGTLLPYALGACEDHTDDKPVEKFSVGYMIGLAMHFYELVGKPLKLHDYLDFGLEYWNLSEGGWSLFYKSFWGGTNGGGTPSVCNRDNAANDLTIYAASKWNEKIRSAVRLDKTYEINIVARKSFADYSLRRSLQSRVSSVRSAKKKNPQETDIQEPSLHRKLAKASVLFVKDALTYYGARLSSSAPLETLKSVARKELKHALSVEDRKSSWSDGLCSAVSQVSGNPQQGSEVGCVRPSPPKIQNFEVPSFGGNHIMDLHDHDHFSVVPLPECPKLQYSFFDKLFSMLRKLPSLEV